MTIPWQLAYGASGKPPKIPAKACLIFIMEIVKIKCARVAAAQLGEGRELYPGSRRRALRRRRSCPVESPPGCCRALEPPTLALADSCCVASCAFARPSRSPHVSHLTPLTSRLSPHASHLTPLTAAHLTPLTAAHLTPPTSLLSRLSPRLSPATPGVTRSPRP
jgi:hypothetical protein